jgi:hypothetical protein
MLFELILKELCDKQIKDIQNDKRLCHSDLVRIARNVNNSLFEHDCSIWDGYITNSNKENKSQYINFFFKSKKIALHRLLYLNFIGPMKDSEYLRFECDNKGKCCCLNHLIKYDKVPDPDDPTNIGKKRGKKKRVVEERPLNFEIDFD